MAAPRFEVVEETDPLSADERRAGGSPAEGGATAVIFLALKALSQRALIALESLFTLITVGSAFWLWMSIPEPNVHQLVGLGMYAAFVLAANVIVRPRLRG